MKNLILLLVPFFIISCVNNFDKDHKKFVVTDFSKKRVDTLIPYESKTYVGYYIKIKGKVDDSVKIQREGYYDIILSKKIDTLINGNYYGTEIVIWTFDPYKAKTGKLEIEYGL